MEGKVNSGSETQGHLETEKVSFELDLNKIVTVALTEYWEQVLKNHLMNLFKDYDYELAGCGSLEEYVEKQIKIAWGKKKGYYQFQLWELMQIFWKCLYLWNDNIPFKNNKIYFSESNKFSYWAERVSDKMDKSLLKALKEI